MFKKTVDVVTNVAGVIDKFVYTKEEKAKMQERMAEVVTSYAEKTFDGSTIRSKSRRYIAWVFCSLFALLVLSEAVLVLFFTEKSGRLTTLIEFLATPIIAIIFFYFGSYGIQGFINNRKSKRGK